MSQGRAHKPKLRKLDALVVLTGYLVMVGLAFALRGFGNWAMRGSDELMVFTGVRMSAEAIPYAVCMIPSVLLHGYLFERFWLPVVKSGWLGWFDITVFIGVVIFPPIVIMWVAKATI